MHKGNERRAVPRRIEAPHERGGFRAEHPAYRLDGRHDRCDAAEGESRGDERHDFPVVGALVSSDDLNGVERGLGMIETGVQGVERVAERV